MKLREGTYQHYKGGKYRMLFIAKGQFSELRLDLEDMVIYESVDENAHSKYWVRPLADFLGEVEYEGKKVPRFTFLEPNER